MCLSHCRIANNQAYIIARLSSTGICKYMLEYSCFCCCCCVCVFRAATAKQGGRASGISGQKGRRSGPLAFFVHHMRRPGTFAHEYAGTVLMLYVIYSSVAVQTRPHSATSGHVLRILFCCALGVCGIIFQGVEEWVSFRVLRLMSSCVSLVVVEFG